MTQIEAASAGQITPEMETVAEAERLDPELVHPKWRRAGW